MPHDSSGPCRSRVCPAYVMRLDVGFDHEAREVACRRRWPSSRASASALDGVADERVDLGGAQVAVVELHVVFPVEADVHRRTSSRKSRTEIPDAGCQHVVVRLVRLQHAPHALDVLGGVAPVANGVEVAKPKFVLLASLDRVRPRE